MKSELKKGDWVWVTGEGEDSLDCIHTVVVVEKNRFMPSKLIKGAVTGWEGTAKATKLSRKEVKQYVTEARSTIRNLQDAVYDREHQQ